MTDDLHVFCCPVCANKVRAGEQMEPLCTGPHPSLDEHPLVPMVLTRSPKTDDLPFVPDLKGMEVLATIL